jgi:hypothetical protein
MEVPLCFFFLSVPLPPSLISLDPLKITCRAVLDFVIPCYSSPLSSENKVHPEQMWFQGEPSGIDAGVGRGMARSHLASELDTPCFGFLRESKGKSWLLTCPGKLQLQQLLPTVAQGGSLIPLHAAKLGPQRINIHRAAPHFRKSSCTDCCPF